MTANQKTAVVTGATSGLGEHATLALAKEGWKVFAIGRDAERGAQLVAKASGQIEFLSADLFSIADVKRLARELEKRAPRLDLLINNAGGTFGSKQLTQDGLERTFALNVVAPFVLTEELVGPLAAAKGRVMNIVTGVPNKAKATLDQLAGDESSAGMGSYIRNKLALLSLTGEQQKRFGARGITVVSLHPGIIPGTRFGQDIPAFLRAIGEAVAKVFGFGSSLDQAAERYIRVGSGAVEGGGFYKQGELTSPPSQALDAAFASQLWTKLEQVSRL